MVKKKTMSDPMGHFQGEGILRENGKRKRRGPFRGVGKETGIASRGKECAIRMSARNTLARRKKGSLRKEREK